MYRRRIVDARLDRYLAGLPAVAVEGMRAVGKTSTAQQRAAHSIRLDDPESLRIIQADMAQLVSGTGTILVDEWQRLPAVWDYVRRRVDDGAPPGRFILTGSAVALTGPVHTGAGRIVSLRMRPMALAERDIAVPTVFLADLLSGERPEIGGQCSVGLDGYVHEIVASGLPGIRGLEADLRDIQLDGYLEYALNHEATVSGGAVRRPDALRRWFASYAASSSTTASYNAILDAATPGLVDKPARSTVEGYREALARLWLLDPVPAWVPQDNPLEQLTSSPKHQVADPALAARVLGLSSEALLGRVNRGAGSSSRASLLGPLFESLVTLSTRVYAEANGARTLHLRTPGGRHEVDLIVERADGGIVPIEVKLSATVDDADVRHLNWLRAAVGDAVLDAVIVTTGSRAYRRADGIAVVPAALLGA